MHDPTATSQSAAGSPSATALIEAVLLVSPRPVTLSALLSATALSEPEARAAIGELERRYSPVTSGIVLREVSGGFQLATNPLCSATVERCRARGRDVVSVDRVASRHKPLDGVLSLPIDLLTDPLPEVPARQCLTEPVGAGGEASCAARGIYLSP